MFNSSNNTVSILEDGKEEKLESPDAYVAYSKSGSVVVSDSKILEMCLHTYQMAMSKICPFKIWSI